MCCCPDVPPADGLAFARVQRVLSLFAQGLAGRQVALRAADEGDALRADARGLCLPACIQGEADERRCFGLYRALVLRQLGWLLEGGLAIEQAVQLAREQPDTQAALPAHLQAFVAHPRPRWLGLVFRALEDRRIDRLQGERHPGARADLARLRAWPVDALPALVAARVADAPQPLASAHDSVRAALLLCAPAAGEAEPALPGPDAPAAALDAPLLGQGPDLLPPALRQQLRTRGAGAALALLPPDATAVMAGDEAAGAATDTEAPGPVGDSADTGAPSYLYDEWDHRRQRYLGAWCRVHELRLRGGDSGFVQAARRRHAALARQVRQQFAAIRPESLQYQRRCNDGDELDLDALLQARIDRRAGRQPEELLHRRQQRARRDVAAAFLVDMSASTDFVVPEPGATPEPPSPSPAVDEDDHYLYGFVPRRPTVQTPKRRVIDVEKEAIALMADALQRLGDAYAVYGFSGEGRHRVEFHIAKQFNEPLDGRAWSALAAMQPRGGTRMGPAIRHALQQLRRQPARLKLLLIVSDGYPQDQGYGPDRDDEDYGLQDTARALREAEAAGVLAFCLTVDPAGHDYLRRMCAPQRYLVIDEVAGLPAALSQVYRMLSAGVRPARIAATE